MIVPIVAVVREPDALTITSRGPDGRDHAHCVAPVSEEDYRAALSAYVHAHVLEIVNRPGKT